MGLRSGKASAWERLGWGMAAVFFGVGFWAAGKYWLLERELKREWGAMGELHGLELEACIRRMCLLLKRHEGWWVLAVGAAAWALGRKRRKAAGLGGLSFAGGSPAPPAAGEDDDTTRPGDGGDGIRSRETRGE